MAKFLLLVLTTLGGAGLVSLFERWRWQRRAGGRPGVLSSVQASTDPSVDDAELVRLLQEAIERDFTQPTAIHIQVAVGVVTLSGTVLASEHERLLARVYGVPGVRLVKDQLQTQQQRGDLPDIHTGAERHDDEGV